MEQQVTRVDNVARITTSDNRVVGWNFFAISEELKITGNGQVKLTDEQVTHLNQLLTKDGFSEQLEIDHEAKFVVGFVESCQPTPDSDHLSITRVDLKNEKVKLVWGAPNNVKGINGFVAKTERHMQER